MSQRSPSLFLWPILLLTVLLAAGCVTPISAVDARPTLIIDTDPLPVIAVAPVVGRPGTTVFVSGAGWEPNDAVFINLAVDEDPEDDENELLEVTVAASTVAADTRFAASFLYPYDPPWSELDEVTIIAYSPDSGDRAEAPFTLVPDSELTATVTPTATMTATVTATATVMPATKAPATKTPTPGEGAYGSATVISNALNVRTGPSTAYPVIRQIERGDTMAVLGKSADNYWLYIELPDGLLGWVAKYYTDYQGSPPVVKPTGVPNPPVSTPTPAPMPPSPASRWVGEYFNNVNLSGAPALVRNDYSLNFNWGFGSPDRRIQSDYFSARWIQPVYFPGGTFRFFADTDDGVRIYVDDVLILDEWKVTSGVVFTADRTLTRGTHIVRVEYFENTELAKIRVWWDRSDGVAFPDWKGEYYNNESLSGAPSLVRNDATIDFNWGYGSPSSRIQSDYFSARWSRTVYLDADRYRFHSRMDDGMRVYLDGNLIINEWSTGSVRDRSVDRDVAAGYHNIVVEYYERTQLAEAKFWWETIGSSPPPDSFPDWKGEYWSNRSLDGSPKVVRNDRRIDFNWGTGSPDSRIPSDNFSARWTRKYDFSDGWYRFSARSDDGVRVWVDGDRIIDEWHDSKDDVTYTADKYVDGKVKLKVEYYERYGGAAVKVKWEKISDPHTPTPTPTGSLTPTPTYTPSTKTPTPDVTPSPSAKIQPDSGLPGTSIVVSGGGFPANTTVNIHLASPVRASSAANPDVYASTQSDSSGHYSVLVTLPMTWPGGSPIETGELLVIAATPAFDVTASAVFEVTAPRPTVSVDPYAQLQPRTGGPGTTVVVSGGGFPKNTTVSIHLGGLVRSASASAQPKTYADGPSDGNGNYRITFTMPDIWPDGSTIEPGKINVVAATSNFGVQASALFDYQRGSANPSLSLSPSSGGAGTVVTVRGEGYPTNKTVSIYLGTFDESVGSGEPFLYGSTKTDIAGELAKTISMPAVWPDGVPVASGKLVVWARTDDNSVQQSATFSYTGGPAPVPTDTPTPVDTPAVPPTATPNPNAKVSPSSGGGGTQVIVTGGGFPANTTVNAMLSLFDANGGGGDAEIYGTNTTNDNGDYSISFTMPSNLQNGQPIASSKTLIVVATNDFRVSAGAPFDYVGVTAAGDVVVATPSPVPPVKPSPAPSPEVTPSPEAEEETPTPEPDEELPAEIEETSTVEPDEDVPAAKTPTKEVPTEEPTEEAPTKEVPTEEPTAEAPPVVTDEPVEEPPDEPSEQAPDEAQPEETDEASTVAEEAAATPDAPTVDDEADDEANIEPPAEPEEDPAPAAEEPLSEPETDEPETDEPESALMIEEAPADPEAAQSVEEPAPAVKEPPATEPASVAPEPAPIEEEPMEEEPPAAESPAVEPDPASEPAPVPAAPKPAPPVEEPPAPAPAAPNPAPVVEEPPAAASEPGPPVELTPTPMPPEEPVATAPNGD